MIEIWSMLRERFYTTGLYTSSMQGYIQSLDNVVDLEGHDCWVPEMTH